MVIDIFLCCMRWENFIEAERILLFFDGFLIVLRVNCELFIIKNLDAGGISDFSVEKGSISDENFDTFQLFV